MTQKITPEQAHLGKLMLMIWLQFGKDNNIYPAVVRVDTRTWNERRNNAESSGES
jgi:hypothetical protein